MPVFRVKKLAESQDPPLNITRLANRAGMPRTQLLPIWRDEADRPAIGTLRKIADALGVPLWALFDDAPDPTDDLDDPQ